MSNCNQISVLGVIYDIEDSTARTGLEGKQDTITSSNKLDATLIQTSNSNLFVTSTEKSTWSAKQDEITSSNMLDADLVDDDNATNKFVTASEKSTWTAKQDAITSSNKLDATLVQTSDSNLFVTASEKSTWNAKADISDIPTALSELTDDATHRLVTDTEKTTWTAKQDAITSSDPLDADLVDDDDSAHKFVSSSEKTRWNNKQDTISSSNMVDADFVDDSGATHQFVSSSEKTTWNGKVNISDIVNNVTSTETAKPLSANQGKLLNDRINNLETIGRFLSLWNCATGLPTTNPTTLPYTYKTGDYYIITTVSASTNYKPNGATYTGTASTTTTSDAVATGDIWRYDGTTWSFESNHSSSSGVSDVQINSTSIVSAGVADLSVESTPVQGSVKMITSGAVYQRIRYGTAAQRQASSPSAGDVWIEISS